MAKRTKKTHPERAVLKGSGVSMLLQRYKFYSKQQNFFAKSFIPSSSPKPYGYADLWNG